MNCLLERFVSIQHVVFNEPHFSTAVCVRKATLVDRRAFCLPPLDDYVADPLGGLCSLALLGHGCLLRVIFMASRTTNHCIFNVLLRPVEHAIALQIPRSKPQPG